MGVSAAQQRLPMYAVLVDNRDRDDENSHTYVAEENIVLVEKPTESLDFHQAQLQGLFTTFHAKMNSFSPKPKLRQEYPKD